MSEDKPITGAHHSKELTGIYFAGDGKKLPEMYLNTPRTWSRGYHKLSKWEKDDE